MTTNGLQQQLTETIQIYFDRDGINEKANVSVEVVGTGKLDLKLHTSKLLDYEQLMFIDNLAYLLMPLGLMYELVNISTDEYGEQKFLPDGFEVKIGIAMPPNFNPSTPPVEYKNEDK